jgi:cytoskeletal protein RodZ
VLPLTELGNRLKEARETKGLTLDDLQEITKIQKRYLAGIEEGNFDVIPGKFYVRAFIKQYAEAVDLDPESLFEEFRNEIPSVHDQNITEQLSRTQTRTNVAKETSRFLDNLPKLVTALIIIAIVVIGWYFFTKAMGNNDDVANAGEDVQTPSVSYDEVGEPSENDKTDIADDDSETEKANDNDQKNEALEEEQEPDSKTQQLKAIQTEGTTTTYELTNADTFKLEVKVTPGGQSWVEVYNTDKSKQFFKEMLTEENPQSYDFSEENGARLRIGATGVTEIYVNGEKLEYATEATVQNIIIQYNNDEE